jgi:ribonuclease J
MKITVYRPNQIGGCITEIESRAGTRIIIDIGSNLPGNQDGEKVDVKTLTAPERCAGVFVTHYHGDHIGEYKNVHGKTNIYIGEVAKQVFSTLQKRLSKSEEITGVTSDDVERVNDFKAFTHGNPITNIPGFKITPIRTDHSAFDSYMFLIDDGEKRVLHTGDFRTHGWTGVKAEDALAEYAGRVNALICEGTMLSRERSRVYTENDLYHDAKKLLRHNRNVFVLCSSTNIDTIASFYMAAQEGNGNPRRRVVADGYQKSVLKAISNSATDLKYDMKYVSVYLPDKDYKAEEDRIKRQHCLDEMTQMGFCMFIRATPFFEEPLRLFRNNLIIYSMWEGYLEENKPYTDAVKIDFLNKAKANGSILIPLHTSGHAYEDTILKICDKIKPEIIMPIHSERSIRFEELKNEGKIAGRIMRMEHKKSVEI